MNKCKEYKALAREKLQTNRKALIGAFLLMVLIVLAFVIAGSILLYANMEKAGALKSEQEMIKYFNQVFFNDDSIESIILSYAGSVFIGALMQTLAVGFINVCYKVANGEAVKATDIFEVYKQNPDKIILIYLVSSLVQFIIALPSNALTIYIDYANVNDIELIAINSIVSIVTFLIQLIVKLLMALSFYAYIDDKETSVFGAVIKSITLMKRYAFVYLYIILSFLGWFLLAGFTYGIALIYVYPYFYITLCLFYINIKENTEKELTM